jgi:hypothetical protein
MTARLDPRFDLVVTTAAPGDRAEFRLLDGAGNQLAYHAADLGALPAGLRQGLFDPRGYLLHYVEESKQREALAEVGVCIAERVLGEAVFRPLW